MIENRIYKDGLVSVVLPIYNTSKFLDRCISSVVNQTYTNLEILLIDDGSTDNSLEVCNDWAKRDDRIKVIHKENEGLGYTRNRGIENATGEYICFFDSDDFVDEDAIEKSYNLAKSENADVVLFGLHFADFKGNIKNTIIPSAHIPVYSGDEVRESFLPYLIGNDPESDVLTNYYMSACLCLYSTKVIIESGWRFASEREVISEDTYSLLKLYKYVEKVAILSEAFYYYCENTQSLSRAYKEDRYKKICDFYYKCLEVQRDFCYNKKVESRLSGLYLSFAISAMKQIVSANGVSFRKRYKDIKEIVLDETMQKVLSNLNTNHESKARKVLFLFIKKKMALMTYGLLKMQSVKDKA